MQNQPAEIGIARAETDLSSVDHYSEVLLVTISGSSNQLGVVMRFEVGGGDNDFYFVRAQQVNDKIEISKLVGGVLSDIGDGSSQTPAGGDTIKGQVDGDNLKSFYNDTELDSETDTAVPGGTRCGMFGFDITSNPTVDDFEAADLAAAGQPTMRRWGGIPHMTPGIHNHSRSW